jgi:hypothetical protein
MTGTIVALPVDGRPVTCDQVELLAQVAGWRLLLPPRKWLGQLRQPGNRDQLASWLLEVANEADGLVLSIDMLVYGGLVPSRLSDEDEVALADRLAVLHQIRERHPKLPISVFAATMRISNNDHAEEERPYWAHHGSEIWRWSYHSDRYAMLGHAEDNVAATAAEASIPPELLDDYRRTRARNFAITSRVVGMTQAGILDYLVLPQDDTAAYGVNIAETRALLEMSAQADVGERIASYPGADEVIWTQIARLIAKAEGVQPRFALDWAEPDASNTMVARYEDRPIGRTLADQIGAVGGVITDQVAEGVIHLFLHTAGMQQGEWALDIWPTEPPPASATDWLDRLELCLAAGCRTAVLDLAHANGGDPAMIERLGERITLDRLHAYAGWNTAGNSIGSVVAICAVPARDLQALRRLLATRFIDDLVYQSGSRQQIRAAGIDVATPEGATTAINGIFLPQANAWLSRNSFTDVTVVDAWFPWRRSFEIGFEIAGVPSPGANA